MTGEEKLKKVFEEYVKETKKECYKIEIIDGIPDIMDDKIGGIPYLPIGEEIPKDSDGYDLPLALQINLKNIDLEDFPHEGILEIYANMLDTPCEHAIRFYKEGAYRTDLTLNCPDDSLIIDQPCKIKLTKDYCCMPCSDYRFMDTIQNIVKREFGGTNEMLYKFFETQNWMDLFYKNIRTHEATLGGYADFTQQDPREDQNSDMDECLCKIDSNLNPRRIYIGSYGILFALISKDNLKTENFNEALVDWDCG